MRNKFVVLTYITFVAVSNLYSQSVSNKPNVILITIDTLRADSLGFNGSKNVQTPNLDSLAAQGINFTRTRAAVPLTLPSHASLMTGLYPVQHGIRDNGTARLTDEFVTLAEIFKQNGYRTAAFVGSFVLDHRFGLNQGFDTYEDTMPVSMVENQEAERNAEAVYQAFSKWYQQNNQFPFFVWIHFYDPHAPYNPPEPFRTKYKKDPYVGEIAYTDSVIGKVLTDLKSKRSNIIAVAGDHGEGLGQHQEHTHSLLIYNSTLHVPMILISPDRIKTGTKYEELSRLIDLAPTVLEYANIPSKLAGSGISLKSAIENNKIGVTENFGESLYPKLNLGWSDLKGVETEKYRYIDAPKAELYEVVSDPGETQNVIEKYPQEARKLKSWIDQFYQKHSSAAKPASAELDPETKEKLASLGYVSSSSANAPTSSTIDPKDKIEMWNNIQKGIFLYGKGTYNAAIQIFEPLLKTEKSTRIVYDNLCSLYLKTGQLQKAQACIQQAITNGVDFAKLHVYLGEIYHSKNNYDLAEKEFRIALAMDELNASAHYFLANTLRAAGKPLKAITEYQKALEMNPRYVFAMNGLAMSYSTLKRNEEAFRVFNLAAEHDPQNPAAYFNLAIQAEKMNKTKEAIGAYKKFLELANEKKFGKQRQKAQESIRRLSNS